MFFFFFLINNNEWEKKLNEIHENVMTDYPVNNYYCFMDD